MRLFQALEYFTNWGLVLAIIIVINASLALTLLVATWRNLVYRHKQATLTSRLRRRLIREFYRSGMTRETQ
jgi:hypothetical protein